MRFAVGTLLAVAGVLLLTAQAGAAVSCSRTGDTLNISAGAAGDVPQIARSGDAISVVNPAQGPDPLACSGGPTVHNTGQVNVSFPAGAGANEVVLNLNGGPFAPGTTPEGYGRSEIEFQIDMGDGSGDSLALNGKTDPPAPTPVRLGALGPDQGVNLNPPETGAPDSDVRLMGVEDVSLSMGGLFANEPAQNLDLSGGAEFSGPYNGSASVEAGNGEDRVVTGAGLTVVDALGGDDVLVSGPGNDTLRGDPAGADTGTDTLSYETTGSAVSVTLASGSAQATGGGGTDTLAELDIENLTGSPFGDVLFGDDTANEITGGGGVDAISAGGGPDVVYAADGTAGDQIDCGGGVDTAELDGSAGQSTDLVANCDNIVIADVDPPETELTNRPADRIHSRRATFEFTSSEPAGAAFRCKLDREAYGPCTSPKVLRRLDPGRHTFKVYALDAAGNADLTPAADKFRVIVG